MTEDRTPEPSPLRLRTTVADRATAEQVVIDLTEHGVAREHVTTQPVADAARPQGTGEVAATRETGEADIAFTEATGKTMGAGWLIGALIGAVVGALGVTLLFEPPWESGLAAGITLAVAIGVGYLAGGLGLLQAGIARTGETGGRPLTKQRPGHREHDRPADAPPAGEAGFEIVVDATTEEEARSADAVLDRHRDHSA